MAGDPAFLFISYPKIIRKPFKKAGIFGASFVNADEMHVTLWEKVPVVYSTGTYAGTVLDGEGRGHFSEH